MAGNTSAHGLSLSQLIKATSAKCLINILKTVGSKKDLVIDNSLIGPLDHIAGVTVLREYGVEKIYKLDFGLSPGQNNKCLYLIRPCITSTRQVADHISAARQQNRDVAFWIVFVPRKLHVCELILEQEGVYDEATLLEYPLGLIPLDNDIFSLEISDFFSSFYLNGDQGWIHTVASSLVQLQRLFGPVHCRFGQGRCAKLVFDLMETLEEETKITKKEDSKIGKMIVLDREIDYVSVLLTQLTYEGLLDETFGIKSGRVTFGKEVTGKDQTVKLALNNNDEVHREIRNRHMSHVFTHLKETANEIQARYNKRHGMSLGDMKNFVKNELQGLQQQHKSLGLHISACEAIMKQKNKDFEDQLLNRTHFQNGAPCDYFVCSPSARMACLLEITDLFLSSFFRVMVIITY
ncbi:vacuolar protein sorting-associated protein 33B-like [Tachypleus tridentatus]|uniref:vacuolar protein sorting-associated protein 33B-like n=1 Tax=Tachypleus tridentatus TaxID=6853 RepID=UPI003FD61FC6